VSAPGKGTAAPDLSGLAGVPAEMFLLASQVVVWGYPAVKFEQLMQVRTTEAILAMGNPRSAVNQLGLVRSLRGPEFKQIATPNNDTLYAQSFCDVSREPLVLSVPEVEADRYYTFQLWDPNGDTFGYVGSRTTGHAAGHFAFVGPGWSGTLPDGMGRIDCPYSSFALWGRIGVDGPDDLAAAQTIQDEVRLTPLSQFGNLDLPVAPDLAFSEERVAAHYPDDLPEDLRFYAELARALRFTPPKPIQDAVVVDSLSRLGFTDGGTGFDHHLLTEAQRDGLAKAAQFALHVMDVTAQTVGLAVNGWRWSPKSGVMGTDYPFRAAFAKWYTGGNAPEEAIYMDAHLDGEGHPLSGANSYTLTFAPGQEPPAAAFWSLSMYDLADGSFVANPIDRYTVGDRTPGLTRRPDGSLVIHIQHDAPVDPAANWLPAPVGGFYLNLRLYVPDHSLQDGTWAPPRVTPIDPFA